MKLLSTLIVGLLFGLPILLFSSNQATYAASPLDPLEKACSEGVNNASSSEICMDSVTGQTMDPVTGPNGVILRAANILAVVAGIISIIILIVVGIMYMLSGGDSGKLNTYRNAIIYTLVGAATIIVSRTLVVFVINGLG